MLYGHIGPYLKISRSVLPPTANPPATVNRFKTSIKIEDKKKKEKKIEEQGERISEYLAGQQSNAASVGLLIDAHDENGTDLKREEFQAVDVAAKGFVIYALNPLRIQHGILARWQTHVLRCGQ